MRFIEITSRNKKLEMMSYDKLNGWLRKKARHAVVVCYYGDKTSSSMRYEFISGNNDDEVPAVRDGMELERVVL